MINKSVFILYLANNKKTFVPFINPSWISIEAESTTFPTFEIIAGINNTESNWWCAFGVSNHSGYKEVKSIARPLN